MWLCSGAKRNATQLRREVTEKAFSKRKLLLLSSRCELFLNSECFFRLLLFTQRNATQRKLGRLSKCLCVSVVASCERRTIRNKLAGKLRLTARELSSLALLLLVAGLAHKPKRNLFHLQTANNSSDAICANANNFKPRIVEQRSIRAQFAGFAVAAIYRRKTSFASVVLTSAARHKLAATRSSVALQYHKYTFALC